MVYIKWATLSFKRHLIYRAEYFLSLFNALVYIFIFTSLWEAIFVDEKERTFMVSYAVFATLIKASVARSRDLLGEKIRTGEIALEFMKPVAIPLILLADAVGSLLFQSISRGIPLLFFSLLFFALPFPPGIDFLFALSFLLSFLNFYALLFFYGAISFFLMENLSLWFLHASFLSLLSGAIFPVHFLPSFLQEFAYFTPYPYLFYIPTQKLLQDSFPFPHALERQLLSFFFTWSVAYWVYWQGRKRLYIQGG